MRKVMLFIFLSGTRYLFSQAAVSSIPYSTQQQVYTQSFDGLPGTGTFTLTGKGPFNLDNAPFTIAGLSGWQFLMTAGTNANAGFLVSTGSATGNGVQSLGATGGTDRALGSLSAGSAVYAIGVIFTNNTGTILHSITVSFTAEQWRKGGSGNKNTWSFHYKTGLLTTINAADLSDEPHLNFSSLITTTGAGSMNGNLPENRQNITYTITGINWKPGEQLLLRWDDGDETGNDDACAIDDFRFSAEQGDAPVTAPVVPLPVNTVVSFTALTPTLTNTQSVAFTFKTAEPVSGLSTANFSLVTAGTINASIVSIVGTGSAYTVTVNTGTGDGTIRINLVNDDQLSTTFNNQPVAAAGYYTIDKSPPFIKGIQIMQRTVYKANDTLLLVAKLSENVYINRANGAPSIRLTIGNTSRTASYLSGSGTDSLVFMYTIISTDEDSSGFKLPSAISLNSSIIRDEAGNNLLLTIPAYTGSIRIDGVSPKINSITVPAAKYYKANDTLVFTVNFTEDIIANLITDTILLKITVGSSVKSLYCYEAAGTQALRFRYIVQKNDLDKTGITMGALTTTAPYSITDAAGNPCSLTIKNAGPLSNVKIDAVAPSFVIPALSDLFACSRDSAVSLSDILMLIDDEKGDSLTLRIQSLRHPSSLLQNTFTFLSTGNKISPATILYTLPATNKGTDSLRATISDGTNEIQKIIRITIHPQITNNDILTTPYACSGSSITITGTEPSGGNGHYEYLWEYTNTSDSLGFVKTSGLNSLRDLGSSPKLSSTTFFRRKVNSGACSDTSAPVKIIPLKSGIWFGGFTNEWTNPNNWCNTIVPGAATDVYITNSKNHPTIQDTASCHDITLAKDVVLTVNGSLHWTGNMNGPWGLIDLAKGKLTVGGTFPQKILTGIIKNQTIKDLFISNPTEAALTDSLFLTGILQLVSGSLQTANRLLVRSSGSIGQSADGVSINGNVLFEHKITGKKALRLTGHPFSADILLETQNNSSYYEPQSPFDTLPIYIKWTNFQNPWKKYTGLGVLTDSTSLLKFTGPVNAGDQEIVLTKTDSTAYQLIANPYASTIDLSLVSYGTGIGNHFWIWDINQGDEGGYSAVPFQSKYLLPAFGAFFVKTTGFINNTILFTENCKTNLSASTATAVPVINDLPDYHIELRLNRDQTFMDRIIIGHSDSAWLGLDKYDAEKFMNSGVNFYSLSREKKMLSIDFRPLKNTAAINLGLQTTKTGYYSIQIPACKLSTENTLQLHDKYMNKWLALEKDSSYSFLVTDDTLTSGNNRFEISSRPEPIDSMIYSRKIMMRVGPVPAINEIMIHYAIAENGNTSIRILDQYGNIKRSLLVDAKKSGEISLPINNLLPGLYFVEMISGKYVASQKFIKL